ncbi:unnamed protein product [Caenorhabditis auriculariae]|uniref:Uncharacterized protein n=1 Tax=Caenorhabditis auriculariae TaxID=2777116 RepID=A0A8S1H489_9PELO|nr:unnamed protein product [Caenorhabditis auriculariae]
METPSFPTADQHNIFKPLRTATTRFFIVCRHGFLPQYFQPPSNCDHTLLHRLALRLPASRKMGVPSFPTADQVAQYFQAPPNCDNAFLHRLPPRLSASRKMGVRPFRRLIRLAQYFQPPSNCDHTLLHRLAYGFPASRKMGIPSFPTADQHNIFQAPPKCDNALHHRLAPRLPASRKMEPQYFQAPPKCDNALHHRLAPRLPASRKMKRPSFPTADQHNIFKPLRTATTRFFIVCRHGFLPQYFSTPFKLRPHAPPPSSLRLPASRKMGIPSFPTADQHNIFQAPPNCDNAFLHRLPPRLSASRKMGVRPFRRLISTIFSTPFKLRPHAPPPSSLRLPASRKMGTRPFRRLIRLHNIFKPLRSATKRFFIVWPHGFLRLGRWETPSFPTADQHNIFQAPPKCDNALHHPQYFQAPPKCDNALHHRLAPRLPASRKRETPSFPTADQVAQYFQAPPKCDKAFLHRLAPRLPASRKRETPSFPTADQVAQYFSTPFKLRPHAPPPSSLRLPASRKMGTRPFRRLISTIFSTPLNCDHTLLHRLSLRLSASRKMGVRPFRRLISTIFSTPFKLRPHAPPPSSLRLPASRKMGIPSFPTADQVAQYFSTPFKLRPHAPPPSSLRLSASRKMGVRPFRRLIRLAKYFQAPPNCDNAFLHRLPPRHSASRKMGVRPFRRLISTIFFKPLRNCDNALHHRLAPRLSASRKMGVPQYFQAPSNCDNALHHRLAPRLPASRKRKLRPFRRLISTIFSTPFKLRPHAPPPSSLRLPASRKMGVPKYFQAPPNCDNAFLHRLPPRLSASRKMGVRPFRRLISTIFSTPFKLRPHAPPPSSLRLPASRKMGTPQYFQAPPNCDNAFLHRLPPRLSASRKMGVRPFRRLISTIFSTPFKLRPHAPPPSSLRLPASRKMGTPQYFQAPPKCDNAFLHRLAPRLPASRKRKLRPFRRLISTIFSSPFELRQRAPSPSSLRLPASRKMGTRPFRRLIRWHNIFNPLKLRPHAPPPSSLRLSASRKMGVRPFRRLISTIFSTPFKLRPHAPPPSSLRLPASRKMGTRPFRRLISTIFSTPFKLRPHAPPPSSLRLSASRKMGVRPFRRLIRLQNIFKPLRTATTRFFIVCRHGILRLGRWATIFSSPLRNCDNALHHRLAPRLSASRKMGVRPFRRLISTIFSTPSNCDHTLLHRLALRLPASRKMGVRPFRRLISLRLPASRKMGVRPFRRLISTIFSTPFKLRPHAPPPSSLRLPASRKMGVRPFRRLIRLEDGRPSFPTADQVAQYFQAPSNCDNALHHRLAPRLPASRKMGKLRPFRRLISTIFSSPLRNCDNALHHRLAPRLSASRKMGVRPFRRLIRWEEETPSFPTADQVAQYFQAPSNCDNALHHRLAPRLSASRKMGVRPFRRLIRWHNIFKPLRTATTRFFIVWPPRLPASRKRKLRPFRRLISTIFSSPFELRQRAPSPSSLRLPASRKMGVRPFRRLISTIFSTPLNCDHRLLHRLASRLSASRKRETPSFPTADQVAQYFQAPSNCDNALHHRLAPRLPASRKRKLRPFRRLISTIFSTPFKLRPHAPPPSGLRLPASRKMGTRPFRRLISTIFSTPFKLRPHAPPPSSLRLPASRKMGTRPFRRLISTIFSTPLNCDHTLLHRLAYGFLRLGRWETPSFPTADQVAQYFQAPSNCDNALHHRLAPRLPASRKRKLRPFRRLISTIFSTPFKLRPHAPPPSGLRLPASRKMGVRPFRRLIRWEEETPSFPTADQVAQYFQAPSNCDNALHHRLAPRLSASRKRKLRPFRRLIRWHNIFKPPSNCDNALHHRLAPRLSASRKRETPSFPTADQVAQYFQAPSNCDNALHHRLAPRLSASRKRKLRPFRRLIRWCDNALHHRLAPRLSASRKMGVRPFRRLIRWHNIFKPPPKCDNALHHRLAPRLPASRKRKLRPFRRLISTIFSSPYEVRQRAPSPSSPTAFCPHGFLRLGKRETPSFPTADQHNIFKPPSNCDNALHHRLAPRLPASRKRKLRPFRRLIRLEKETPSFPTADQVAQYFQAPSNCDNALHHRLAPRLPASRKEETPSFPTADQVAQYFQAPSNCDNALHHRLAPRLPASRKEETPSFPTADQHNIFQAPSNCDNALHHRLAPRLSASRKMGVRPFRRLIRWEKETPSFPTADQVAQYFQAPSNCDNALHHRLAPRLPASRKRKLRPFRRLISTIFSSPFELRQRVSSSSGPHGFLRLGRGKLRPFRRLISTIFSTPFKLRPHAPPPSSLRLPASRKMGTRPFRRLIRLHNIFNPLKLRPHAPPPSSLRLSASRKMGVRPFRRLIRLPHGFLRLGKGKLRPFRRLIRLAQYFSSPSNCDNALHHRLAPRLPASRKRETPSFPTADQVAQYFQAPSNCDNALHHRLAPRLSASRKMGVRPFRRLIRWCDNALHHRLAPRLPASRKRETPSFPTADQVAQYFSSPFELRQRATSPSSPHGFLRLGKRETPSFPTADQHNIFKPPSNCDNALHHRLAPRLPASRKRKLRPFRRLIRLEEETPSFPTADQVAQYFQAPSNCDNALHHRLAPRLPASRKRKLRPFRRLISTIFSTPFKLRPHAPPPSSLRLPASRKMGTRPFRRLISTIFSTPFKLRPHAPPPSSLRLSASRKMGVRPFRRLIRLHNIFKPLRSATTRFFIVWPSRLPASRKRETPSFPTADQVAQYFQAPSNCDNALHHRLAPRLPASRKMGTPQYFQAPSNCDNALHHRLAPRLPASRKMGTRPFRRLIRLHNIFKPPSNCDNALHHRLAPRLPASRKRKLRPFRRLIRLHNIFKPLRSATTRFFIVWPHGFLRLGRWETPSFPTADQHNIFKPPSNCDNALHHRLAPRLPASRKMGTPQYFQAPSNCDNALHHRLAPRLPASRKRETPSFPTADQHNIFKPLRTATTRSITV